MNDRDAASIIEAQRNWFLCGATREIGVRIAYLERLADAVTQHRDELHRALRTDLGGAELEPLFTEIFDNEQAIDVAVEQLHDWAHAVSGEPYGVTLILPGSGFPLRQLFRPLIGAIAAGNTAIVAPAADVPACARIAAQITAEVFPPEYVLCLEAGRVGEACLAEHAVDHVFFSGGPMGARAVQAAARRHLTPVTLELDGRRIAVVDETADLDLAAQRIVWWKFFDAGQSCAAADHVYVQRGVYERFIDRCVDRIRGFFGEDSSQSPDYGFIINERNFDRLAARLGDGRIVHGGRHDRARRFIEPTLLDGVAETSPLLQEPLAGPLLPIAAVEELDELDARLDRRERPLAFSFFSADRANQRRVIAHAGSRAVTLNDCAALADAPCRCRRGADDGKTAFDTFTRYEPASRARSGRLGACLH